MYCKKKEVNSDIHKKHENMCKSNKDRKQSLHSDSDTIIAENRVTDF